MAEAAEDILTGAACSICGTYFEHAHGHPVACKSCFADLTKNERKVYLRATSPEIGEGERDDVVV